MFAVLYRRRLHPGAEARLVDGWERVTRAVHATCGSYGSRLHRADDGTWVACARWPDTATRERCDHGEAAGERLVAGSVAGHLGATPVEVASDLLAEPDGHPPPRS